MKVKQGYLLVSDISGYTKFLVDSELVHAKEILDSLLATGTKSFMDPIRILNTRGDAIMAFAEQSEFVQPQSLLEIIKSSYIDFQNQLKLMTLNTNCPCNACSNISSLDLKLFLHHGEYIEQEINGASELQGSDVILINRLMKNDVREKMGLDGYALLTESAIAAMDAAELTESMAIHSENYEHFGDVNMRIWPLGAEWEKEIDRTRFDITPESAWIAESIDVSAPPWKVWDVATDTDHKKQYFDMISVDRTDDLGGPKGVGAEFHCRHDMGELTYVVTDWSPPHQFTGEGNAFGVPVHFTILIEPKEYGSTVSMIYLEPPVDTLDEIEPLFRSAARGAADRLAALLENR